MIVFPGAMQFLRDVPTDWEHSYALDGAIGDFVTIARKDRHSNDWYFGGLTNEDGRMVEQSLSFLDEGKTYQAEIYRDGDHADWDTNPYAFTVETRLVTAADHLQIAMGPGWWVLRYALRHSVLDGLPLMICFKHLRFVL